MNKTQRSQPSLESPNQSANASQTPEVARSLDASFEAMQDLLQDLASQHPVEATTSEDSPQRQEDTIAQQRLGVGYGLFKALRLKHSPTASHALRVAMGISSWAQYLGMEDPHLSILEIAGLMHDIGKIGVPDHILTHPGRLSQSQQALVERCRSQSAEILDSCCLSDDILDIVRFCGTWYDATRGSRDRQRDQLPVGARMLAIVDAYDSMTSNQVYRQAMSQERALAELASHAGTQFDPKLVDNFSRLIENDECHFNPSYNPRWFQGLASYSDSPWGVASIQESSPHLDLDSLFRTRLMDSLSEGVAMVDSAGYILGWNRALERLTGLSSESVLKKSWTPSLLQLTTNHRVPIDETNCPIKNTLGTNVPSSLKVTLRHRQGTEQTVTLKVQPVTDRESTNHGAVVLFQDLSKKSTLEADTERAQAVATRDPLTQVANRTEFDRFLKAFLIEHAHKQKPCCIVVTDLDFFKRINDDFGYEAGDQSLVDFVSILKRYRRQGDLIARFGGEQFVLLCANCELSEAAQIAEEIRQTLDNLPLAFLEHRRMTASFGVTSCQPGDSPQTFFRRAERALLHAKEAGRNRVIQLGTGTYDPRPTPRAKKTWLPWWRPQITKTSRVQSLITAEVMESTVAKIRGFLSDQSGKIVHVHQNKIVIQLDSSTLGLHAKPNSKIDLRVELRLDPAPPESGGGEAVLQRGTQVTVNVQTIDEFETAPAKLELAIGDFFTSLKSYLVAESMESLESK